jgi:integrase
MRGDGIFRRKDCDGYWLSWVDAQGQRRKRKAKGQTLGEARSELEAERVRVRKAIELGFTPPSKDSFADLAERYLAHQEPRLTESEYERQSGIVEKLLKPFFTCKIRDIRRGEIQRYITERSLKAKPATVRKEMNVLKHMLGLAVEWELIPWSPAQRIKLPKPPAGRIRYAQPTELRALFEACPPWLRPIVALGVCTGMRRSEILKLRWLDVDITHNRIMLPQTKNGEGRIVYLNRGAASALESLPFGPDTKATDSLFPEVTKAQVSMAFKRACQDSALLDFRFHDLRHTAASWLRMQGADIHTVALLLGHKDLRMAARYQHLSPGFLAEAVGRLDSIFDVESPVEVPEKPALREGLQLNA